MSALPSRLGARAKADPVARVTEPLQLAHSIESEGRYTYPVRMAVRGADVVWRERGTAAASVEAAAELCRGDALRVAATMLRVRHQLEAHARDCLREADESEAEHKRTAQLAEETRAKAAGIRADAAAARTRASTLLSAVEAARYRMFGGKRVEAAGLSDRDINRSDELPHREPEEQRAALLEQKASEVDAELVGLEASLATLRGTAENRRRRAEELFVKARADGDALVAAQRGRAWTR